MSTPRSKPPSVGISKPWKTCPWPGSSPVGPHQRKRLSCDVSSSANSTNSAPSATYRNADRTHSARPEDRDDVAPQDFQGVLRPDECWISRQPDAGDEVLEPGGIEGLQTLDDLLDRAVQGIAAGTKGLLRHGDAVDQCHRQL